MLSNPDSNCFEIVNVAGDGHCLYHSFILCMQLQNPDPHAVRQKLSTYLKTHKTVYTKLFKLDGSTYKDVLSRLRGDWGQEQEIQLLCDAYNVAIAVFVCANTGHSEWRLFVPQEKVLDDFNTFEKRIYIINDDNVHFQSLLVRNGKQDKVSEIFNQDAIRRQNKNILIRLRDAIKAAIDLTTSESQKSSPESSRIYSFYKYMYDAVVTINKTDEYKSLPQHVTDYETAAPGDESGSNILNMIAGNSPDILKWTCKNCTEQNEHDTATCSSCGTDHQRRWVCGRPAGNDKQCRAFNSSQATYCESCYRRNQKKLGDTESMRRSAREESDSDRTTWIAEIIRDQYKLTMLGDGATRSDVTHEDILHNIAEAEKEGRSKQTKKKRKRQPQKSDEYEYEYECEYDCGFVGTFSAVQEHEEHSCRQKALPTGWKRVLSRSRPGRNSYLNRNTGRRQQNYPAEPAKQKKLSGTKNTQRNKK